MSCEEEKAQESALLYTKSRRREKRLSQLTCSFNEAVQKAELQARVTSSDIRYRAVLARGEKTTPYLATVRLAVPDVSEPDLLGNVESTVPT